jgi:hypothetical protein
VQYPLRQSRQSHHQLNDVAVDADDEISVFVLAHQQPNQLALALLAVGGITFTMRSSETLTRGDSDRIARFG